MTGFIILGIYINDEKTYVSNTYPILWDDDINKSKVFDSYNSAVADLENNFIYLVSLLENTDIYTIWIVEYYNDEEIGRKKFI